MNNGWSGGQYSIFRALLGICVCAWSVPILLGGQAKASPETGEWIVCTSLLVIVPVLSVFLVVGWHDRVASLLISLAAIFFLRVGSAADLLPVVMISLLLIHCSVPPAPYGSLAAWGRIDPGNSWQMPWASHVAAWAVLALVHVFNGIQYLGWLSAVQIAMVALARYPRWRPWCWTGLFLVQFGRMAMGQWVHDGLSMMLLQFFTFDPAWIPALRQPGATQTRQATSEPKPELASPSIGRESDGAVPEQLFYDGHCGLCHRAVRFVLAEDRDGKTFRFAPLDSDAFRAALPDEERKNLPDSMIVRTADGRTLTQARGVLYIMRRLGGIWRIVATAARVIPPALLDALYAGVAAIRHRLFAKPPDACPILPKSLRGRFDF